MSQQPRSQKLYETFLKGSIATYAKGEPVDATDTSHCFTMVMDGYVKNYTLTNSGASSIQILFGRYDVFPLTRAYESLLGQNIYEGPETYYCKTLCETTLSTISATVLTELLASDPSLYRDLFREAGIHLKCCIHHMENMAMHDVYARVAHQLLYLGHEFGSKTGNRAQINFILTHQDIADLVITTRETATRAVIKLRDKNLLDTSGKYIVITDLNGLHEEAYS